MRLHAVETGASPKHWTPEQRAEAHAALDQCLNHCDYTVIVGVGRTHTFEKWLWTRSSNILTLQILGMLQKVVLRGYKRELDDEDAADREGFES